MSCIVHKEVLLACNLLASKPRKYSLTQTHTLSKRNVKLTLKMRLHVAVWIMSQLVTCEGRALLNAHIFCHHRVQVLPGFDGLSQADPSSPELSTGKRKRKGHHTGPGVAGTTTAQRRLSFTSSTQAAADSRFPRKKGMIITNTTLVTPGSSDSQYNHSLQRLSAQHTKALHFLFKAKASLSQTKPNLSSTPGSMLIQSHWLTLPILLNILLTKSPDPCIFTTATASIIILNRTRWTFKAGNCTDEYQRQGLLHRTETLFICRKQEGDRKKQGDGSNAAVERTDINNKAQTQLMPLQQFTGSRVEAKCGRLSQ